MLRITSMEGTTLQFVAMDKKLTSLHPSQEKEAALHAGKTESMLERYSRVVLLATVARCVTARNCLPMAVVASFCATLTNKDMGQ